MDLSISQMIMMDEAGEVIMGRNYQKEYEEQYNG